MKLRNRIIAWISVCSMGCLFLPLLGTVKAAEPDGSYQDAFVKADGTFDTTAAGFPRDYCFDFSKGLTATKSTFFARIKKSFFHAAKESGRAVTIRDGLGVRYTFQPQDIADIPASDFSATVNVGALYQKASYITAIQAIAAANLGIPKEKLEAGRDFAVMRCVAGGTVAAACQITLELTYANVFGGTPEADSTGSGDGAAFRDAAAGGRLYVYEYKSSALTDRPTAMAEAADGGAVRFTRAGAADLGDMYLVLATRPLKQEDQTPAPFDEAFVKADGTFDTAVPGFPVDYRFDFSELKDGKNYYALVTKGFFHAAKASGRVVTIVDGIGVEYSFSPGEIADMDAADFAATVKVGGRYRTTASYKTVADGFAKAAETAGLLESAADYTQHRDYAFLEVFTGENAVTNCTIRTAVDPLGGGAYWAGYYDAAAAGKLYVYQYSSAALTQRATETAGTAAWPQVVLHKAEPGSMQLLLSVKPLREDKAEPDAPPVSAPFTPAFVRDGRFVTDAPGFPADYAFSFGAYGNDEGVSKELFQAIKNSGRNVTLTTRSGVTYAFDGAQMTDLTAAQRAENIQIQALYKTSASFQAVMQKIAGKGQVTEDFFMNQDWVILDVQPWTGTAGFAAANGFPVQARATVRLTGGQSGDAGKATADLFAQYAREGKLKAYAYDKTSSVQDLFEDREPLDITANEAGELCFTVKEPVTLVFSRVDLLSGRNEPEVNTNPYEMRIKKDGKNISDGYTIELGDIQYLDLLMEEGNLRDYEYIWEVVGPGKDCVTLTEVEGSNNLSYMLEAVKESASNKPFQIKVSVKGETDHFIKTGLITVVDTVYGKSFLENGLFKTDAEDFPADYVFRMTGGKYRLPYAFLNAVSESGQDVTVVDTTGIRYLFRGADVEPVPKEDWGEAFAIKALYKDADSYKNVMLSIAYQNGYTKFENNVDYIIVDFQAHGEDLPIPVTAQFELASKTNDAAIAAHFADLMRQGKLYIYAYSKGSQSVYKPLTGFTLTDEGAFSFELWEPVTVVFSAIPLMDNGHSGENSGPDSPGGDLETPDGSPDTGVAFPAAALLCGTAGGALLYAGRRGTKKTVRGDRT